MIKLEKQEEPSILKSKKDTWAKEYLDAKANGNLTDSIKYRYRHTEIKTQICNETNDKCAYCESKITHAYPGDIEHILPQSDFPELIVEWSNLTLSCGECNRRKSDYHSITEPLINPYVDNPKEHLVALGILIYGQCGDSKGSLAELKLGLNRAGLLERRLERINTLRNLAERYKNQTAGALKDLLRDQLIKETNIDKEYTFVSRAFLKQYCDI